MKNFTITKLDRRHKGIKQFSHYITPMWTSTLKDKLEYFEWRTWCWTTWGPGLEREQVLELAGLHDPVKWGWHVDTYSKRLYFATEKELNWFVLTWGS
jgi:hypothetical protein